MDEMPGIGRGTVVKTNPGAVWSLVLGILGLVCCGPLAGIPAVICGHVSRGRIRRSGGTLAGNGMALAGLVLGYIATVLGAVVFLVFLAGFLSVWQEVD